MKKGTVLIVLFALCGSASLLQAWDNVWWAEPDVIYYGESMETPEPTLNKRALIIVAKFPEDTVTYYPALYDSLIAPSMDSVGVGKYVWSITNFLDKASWGQYHMTGSVNPGMNHQYVVAPHSLEWYKQWPFSKKWGITNRVDTLEAHLIAAIDSVVDFKDYDYNNDGYAEYVFFVHPLNPESGFWNYNANKPDSSNRGYSAVRAAIVTSDTRQGYPNQYIKVTTRSRFGAAMSYYHPNQNLKIDHAAASNLACHELGHSFMNEDITHLKRSSGAYFQNLPDRYDIADSGNWNTTSAGIGKYSVMQMGYFTNHPQLYTPWERILLGWLTPTEINQNAQNSLLNDFNGDGRYKAYLIPVDSVKLDTAGWSQWLREYFLVVNYQGDDHWLNDLGRAWPNQLDSGPASDANGVLVWHINERFWDAANQNSELAKVEDLECAEGLKNLDASGPSPMGTEAGWDRLDRWAMLSDTGATRAWNSPITGVDATTCYYTDFFNPSYKGAFHTLTNPSSDGYNCDPRIYNPQWYNQLMYTYPGSTEVSERLVLQNLPTHVGLEGIHYDVDTDIKLCIRRSRIWTDEQMAMDRTTQRKFICDSEDTFHFIYPLRGRVYYTKTYDPSLIWFKAELVGPNPLAYDTIGYGIWPALTLDENREPLVVFFDTSCSKTIYNRRDTFAFLIDGIVDQILIDTLWITPETLRLSGIAGPVAIDYGIGGTIGGVVNPGGTDVSNPPGGGGSGIGSVHLAYITRENNQDKLCYAHFFKTTPDSLIEEILDTAFTEDTRILGASIEVDSQYNKVYIAYGCKKGDTAACYYLMKNSSGWHGPYKFASSKSDTLGEPLVPFLNIDGSYVWAVFNANDNVYIASKPRSTNDTFYTSVLVTDMRGRNRYPQVGGDAVTWTNYATDDSSNVYKRTWPGGATTRFDAAYDGKSYFAQVTKTASGSAQLYQHGIFSGPKWAIYNGSGGNQESDGKPIPFIPPTGFKMSIPNNILVGSRLSIFTTGGDCMITVYDVSGRQVARQELKGIQKLARIETPLDCDGWAKGVYFVRAIPKDGKVATSKVVLVK